MVTSPKDRDFFLLTVSTGWGFEDVKKRVDLTFATSVA